MSKPIPFGKYYLLERINVGGMAEVFKAKAFGVEGFERILAIKRILSNIAEDEEFITMFIDEAKIAGQLQHANIAHIMDLGKVDDDYFIAMEYVSGKDLRAIFDHLRKLDLTTPIPQLCFIAMQVCEGLDYAHGKKDTQGRPLNLVHRDVSPQNVIVGFEGEIKLVDFGIAKAAGKASKTQAGILKGKFGYMSPEQVRGLPVDRRSDIFSLGICMYELITGERLFTGESDFSTLEKVRNVEILPPTTFNKKIAPELERILLKALAKDADDRYQNAIDLHDDLQAYLYSTGEMCSRKDLAAWMKRTWASEIDEENAKLEQYTNLTQPTPGPIEVLDVDDVGAVQEKGGEGLAWDEEELETQIFDKVPEEEELTSSDIFVGGHGDQSTQRPTPVITARGVRPAAQASREDSGGLFESDDKTIAQAPSEELLADMGVAAARLAKKQSQGGVGPSGLGPPGGLSEIRGRVPGGFPPGNRPINMGATMPGLGAPLSAYRSTGSQSAVATPSMPSPEVPASSKLSASRLGAYAQPQPNNTVRNLGIAAALIAAVGLYLYFGKENLGTLIVVVNPIDLIIKVDDIVFEHEKNGSVTIKKKAGPYRIAAEKAGYDPDVREVDVESDVNQKLEITLKPSADTGFQLKSTPSGALVWLDERPLTVSEDGNGPQIQTNFKADRVAPIPHVIELRLDGYENWRYEFVQEPGKLLDINAELVAEGATKPTRPSVAPKPAAAVPVPQPAAAVLTPKPATPAPRPVVAKTPKPAPVRKPVAAAKPPAPEPAGGGEPCIVTLGAKPWAKVLIDGKDTGKITPVVKHEVPCGKRKITFVNSDLKIEKTVSITVKSGEPFKQVFSLVDDE